MNSDAAFLAVQANVPLPLPPGARPTGRDVPIGELVNRASGRASISILQLAFETKYLRTLCESSADAIGELGQEVACVLMERLAELDSAVSIDDLLLGHPQAFDDGELILDLAGGYQIHCRANHPKKPITTSGRIDWTRVSRLIVVEILKPS